MNAIDWITLAIVATIVAAVIITTFKRKTHNDCGNCTKCKDKFKR